MLTEKFQTALNELSSLAGTVPPDVWNRIRPIKRTLESLQGPMQGLETIQLRHPKTVQEDCKN